MGKLLPGSGDFSGAPILPIRIGAICGCRGIISTFGIPIPGKLAYKHFGLDEGEVLLHEELVSTSDGLESQVKKCLHRTTSSCSRISHKRMVVGNDADNHIQNRPNSQP